MDEQLECSNTRGNVFHLFRAVCKSRYREQETNGRHRGHAVEKLGLQQYGVFPKTRADECRERARCARILRGRGAAADEFAARTSGRKI